MIFRSINPATEETIAEYQSMSTSEVDSTMASADKARRSWARRSLENRSMIIQNIGQSLLSNASNLAPFITNEMGKPLAQAEAEIIKCATICDYATNNAHRVLHDKFVPTEFASSTVTMQPLGIVLGIMPWNFPFWQFFRFAAPALIAGNGILLKHAPCTFGCAEQIINICMEGGLPDGLIGNIVVDVPDIERIVADRRVNAVTFTGSTRGGSAVAALAGRYLKKSVMELGGSDPYIILDDANLERAASVCATSRCNNSGQSCISAKRFIVSETVADIFINILTTEMHNKKVGDPNMNVDVGPLARKDLFDTFIRQVKRAVEEGAVPSRDVRNEYIKKGYYVNPIVLTNVQPGSVADTEELFGPAAAVFVSPTDEDAIAMANSSRYGLGAAVFTKNSERAMKFVQELECGTVFINDFVRSDARMPFGGVKDSGYGRELGEQGLLEFVNQKSIVEV